LDLSDRTCEWNVDPESTNEHLAFLYPMSTILITGGSGLIGRALSDALVQKGREVRWLSRTAGVRNGVRAYRWNIATEEVDPAALQGVDHIIHLAGAGIADKRWTATRVKELIDSRAQSALTLLHAAQRNGNAVKSFISAAGINYYGAVTGEHRYTEADPGGADTIGSISVEWEAAVNQWSQVCRVVRLRTPVVLSRKGGALSKLAAPVRLGLGAPLGSGKQWMPWIHLDDLVAVYLRALEDQAMHGAYNVNAPEDATNAEMMLTLAQVLGCPFFLPPLPGFVLKVALGDMSSILLEGSRASNAKLLATGFEFKHPTLQEALEDLLR
jgi:uncharacterized protein (TIGR01777 family)